MLLWWLANFAGNDHDKGVAALISADVFDSLSSFFDSPIWTVLRFLLIAFIILMWFALVIWVFKDARRRNAAPGYAPLMAGIAFVIPFFGPLLYLAVRPAETTVEQHERMLETIALERQAVLRCPDCGFPTEARYLACPSCMRKLKDPCTQCGEPIDPRWSICPFCEKVPAGALGPVAADASTFPTTISREPAQ